MSPALVVTTIAIFAYSLAPRVKAILAGKPDRVRTDQLGRRFATAFKEVLLQTRVIGGRPVAGALHAAVFGGFIFFSLETVEHFLKPFGAHFIPPWYKDVVSAWAVLVSIGIVGLAFRRFAMVKYSPELMLGLHCQYSVQMKK